MIRLGPNEESILREITEKVNFSLNSAGIFNRVFTRIKSPFSIQAKIDKKVKEYSSQNRKMQDVFGIRITLYFHDDEKIAIELIKKNFIELPESHSIDFANEDRFGPQRCNLVFKIDDSLSASSSLFENPMIDKTFEVQFRTVFSEGWHEVEHDLRYKCKDDWSTEDVLNRQLNGQLASLETSSWAMLKIFDEMALKKYRQKEWSSFFRNHLRIRFENTQFSSEIENFLNNHSSFTSQIMKADRYSLLFPLSQLTIKIPLIMDNVLFVINRASLKDENLINLESSILTQILDKSFNA